MFTLLSMIYLSIFFMACIPALISVAFLTLLERKVLSIVGFRFGPFKVSFLGVLQPLIDALKLASKGLVYLTNLSHFFFFMSSFLMLLMSLFLYSFFFSFPSPVYFKYSILIFFLILAFNSFNHIICGWSTFSKFSLVGSIRIVCQLISYEAVLFICLLVVVILLSNFDYGSWSFFNLSFLLFLVPSVFYIWMPTFLAELNRTPFDLAEGESELVSGFNTEHGHMCFTLVFLGEYSNIVYLSVLSSVIFFSSIMLSHFFIFFVLWIRSVLPRFRFDKLMMLSWKLFIPFLSLFFLLFCSFFFF